ncbi:MAG: transporter [Gammaproteobacteria bacterium HGW-Gammaproteobacteria-3]|nr:MAG: transporter [Gammaproteobacteria bacterium HGW-Gammaproteobacteria-3]
MGYHYLTASISGLVFGLGLTVSQMVNPAKVLAFLDVTGAWDPSLALVMAGALGTLSLVRAVFRRTAPAALAQTLPKQTGIDGRLILGAGLFGIGWGLSGFCPGPALASISYGKGEATIFLAALFVGFIVFDRVFPSRGGDV